RRATAHDQEAGSMTSIGIRAAALALAGGLLLSSSPGASDAAPQQTELLTFVDKQDPLMLTIEASPLASNSGEFSFRTATSLFAGVGRASLERHSTNSTHVRYEGPAIELTPTGAA